MTHFLRYSLLILLSFFAFQTFAQSSAGILSSYKVKKKDSLYGIAASHGITIGELMDANPEMKNPKFRLKKNMVLRIPAPQPAVEEQAPETAEPLQLMKTMPGQKLKVGVVLPFTEKDNWQRMVEYYRGFLMACEELDREIEVRAWDATSLVDMDRMLREEFLYDLDLIVGPYYKQHEEVLSRFCAENEIKLFIPFRLSGGDATPADCTFQVYQPESNELSTVQYLNQLRDAQPIFVISKYNDQRKADFIAMLQTNLRDKGIRFRTCDLTCADDIFASLFSSSQRNAIIVNSTRRTDMKALFDKLDFVSETLPETKISLYGYSDFFYQDDAYGAKYFTYDTYIPSAFFFNKRDPQALALEKRYKEQFRGQEVMQQLPRTFLTGYDHAQFFIRGLAKYGSAFRGTAQQNQYEAIQTPLVFAPTADGLNQNTYFHAVHYCPDRSLEIRSLEE